MLAIVRILHAFALIGECATCFVPQLHAVIPLGGSELAQLGIILAVSVLVTELRDLLQSIHGKAGSVDGQSD